MGLGGQAMCRDLMSSGRTFVVDFEIAGAQYRYHLISLFTFSQGEWDPESVCAATGIPLDRLLRFLVCDDRISFGEMALIEETVFDREFRVCGTIDLLKSAYPPDTYPDHEAYQEAITAWTGRINEWKKAQEEDA